MDLEHSATHDPTEWTLYTRRLSIRRARPSQQDVDLLLGLWTDPVVMRNVGFPSGLKVSSADIARQLGEQPWSEFDCVLVVTIRTSLEVIGECKLGSPDGAGVSNTDIKLLPGHWQKGYGKEVKLALLEYLFTHTACRRVRATPNRTNAASIRMQESVGGRRTGEGVYQFPESMKAYTVEVPYFEYTVFREDWLKSNRP
jgi:RimJ/RimL family protein N-acetyltransferase